MKPILLIAILAFAASSALSEPEEPPLPGLEGGLPQPRAEIQEVASANQLMANALSHFPKKPLTISGDVIVRRKRGIPVLKRKFEIAVHWGADPIVARYTIREESGADLEQLTVTRKSGQSPEFKYSAGSPLAAADVPDMLTPIQASDMCWLDLTLSFLWWKGGSIKGSEKIRGFDCHIIDIPAPKGKTDQYSRVRLWIEKKINVMLQAEGYDAKDKLLRRLWVRSCKKIDDTWMIKDLEVQRYPVRHRTKLHITEVRVNTKL
ncbi:outer membrane lipoprotein-sorting protein [Verrucomicrobiota bacterium]